MAYWRHRGGHLGDLRSAATICGGLAGTPWRLGTECRHAEQPVAGQLPLDRYRAARRAGAAMSSSELVSFAQARVDEIVGTRAPTPSAKSPRHRAGRRAASRR